MGVSININIGPFILMDKIIKIYNKDNFKCSKHNSLKFNKDDKYCNKCGVELVNNQKEIRDEVGLLDFFSNMGVPEDFYIDLYVESEYRDDQIIYDRDIYCGDVYSGFELVEIDEHIIAEEMAVFKIKYETIITLLKKNNIPFDIKYGCFITCG